MYKHFKHVKSLLALCLVSAVVFLALVFLPDFRATRANGKTFARANGRVDVAPFTTLASRKRNFTEREVSSMSNLGRWLVSPEGTPPPPTVNRKTGPYLILIWRFGLFLERRHIRRFSNSKFSPWDECSVKNCILSYKAEDLQHADAVLFHLHLTKNALTLPRKSRPDQRWIFLTDESPLHTFLYPNQRISDYDHFFNWSMSYRMDSDVPVPYGRTILQMLGRSSYEDVSLHRSYLTRSKTKLVAVMGSNCGGNNGRWDYVRDLKEFLGNELDVFGACLNGDTTTCPGHFDRDCPPLDAYKFYLAFENSDCKEYLTEKVFWHGYEKSAVPIVMGASKEDCEKLLPPLSFLHVHDFANPYALANYLKYLGRHDNEYFKYHHWRAYYRVINEHGYFGSPSRHYCRICEALHYNSDEEKVYENLEHFWSPSRDCALSG